VRPAVTFVNYVYSKKNKQQFRHLGIPLTATFIRAAREPAHNKGYGPFPEKVGRPRSKLKGSTTAHVRGGVTPFTSLRNHLIINRYISYFYFDFHLQTTLRHRGLWEGGGGPTSHFFSLGNPQNRWDDVENVSDENKVPRTARMERNIA